MSKFVIECPHCGRYAEAKTGFFARKKIDCACGYTIDVRTDRLPFLVPTAFSKGKGRLAAERRGSLDVKGNPDGSPSQISFLRSFQLFWRKKSCTFRRRGRILETL